MAAGRSHFGVDAAGNAAAVAQLVGRLADILGPVMKGLFAKLGDAASKARVAVSGGTSTEGQTAGGQPATPGAGGVAGLFGNAMRMMNSAGGQQAAAGISGHLQHMAMMQPGGGFGTNLMAGVLPNLGKFAGPWGEVAGSALSLFVKNRAAQKQQEQLNAAMSGGGMPDPTGGQGGRLSDAINGFNGLANRTQSHVQDYNPEAVNQYQRSLRDLNAVFGRMLQPAMSVFKDVVKEVGAAVNALTPHVKPIFEAIRDGLKPFIALGGGVMRQIGAAVAPLFDALAKVIPQLASALKPVAELVAGLVGKGASQLGRLVEQLAGWLPKAVAGVTATLGKMRPALEGIGDAVGQLMEAVGNSASIALGSALESVAMAMKAMAPFAEVLAVQLKGMAKVLEWTARGFARVVELHNKAANLFGYGGMQERGPLERRSADGLAAQGMGTTSVSAMIQQLRERAFAMGGDGNSGKQDPAVRTVSVLEQIYKYLSERMVGDLAEAVAKTFPALGQADEARQVAGEVTRRGAHDARELLRAIVPGYGWSGM